MRRFGPTPAIVVAVVAVLVAAAVAAVAVVAIGAIPDHLGAAPGFVRSPAGPRTPVVVELFTSEGCSSCPPADVFLQKLIDDQPVSGAEIVALGEHVDYWDQQGWKDRFSSAALTNRQQVYATRFNSESIYTPQMVVDGRTEVVGSDANAARRALERAAALPHGTVHVAIEARSGGAEPSSPLRVTLTTSDFPKVSSGDRVDLVIAITEDRLRSNVTRGENHGRTLTHAAVVRYLASVGVAAADGSSPTHAEIPMAADWQRENLKIVAFAQERRGRAIVASTVAPVASR